MANFNPAVPDGGAPNYLGLSQPVSVMKPPEPTADASTGIAITGLGDLISKAAAGADLLVKDTIKDKINAGVDSIRDAYTKSLDTTKAAVTGQPTDNAAGPQLLAQNDSVPYQVQNGVDAAKTLTDALQSGKISPTYYYGRLNALTKNLRSQYPGYTDFIDQHISTMVGGNPANEYISHITADINQQMTSAKTEQEKKMTFLRDNVKYDSGVTYQSVVNGTLTPDQGIANVSKIMGQEHTWASNVVHMNSNEATNKDDVNNLKQMMVYRANTLVTRGVGQALTASGLTGDKIDDLITRAQSGKITLAPQQEQQIVASLNLLDRKLQDGIKQDFINNGAWAKVGPTDGQKIIDDARQYVQSLRDSILNKDTGTAFQNARLNVALEQETKYGLYTGPMGQYLQTQKAFNDTGGPEAVKKYWSYSTTKNASGTSVDDYIRKWAAQRNFEFATQPDLRNDPNAVKTLMNVSNELRKSSLTPDAKAAALNSALAPIPAQLTDPSIKDDAKRNLVLAAYSNQNAGLFNSIQKDRVEGNKQYPGRMAAFTQLFSPEVTKAVHALGPEQWNTYLDRAKTSFGSEIFNGEINDLNEIAANPAVKLTWDTVNHRWNDPQFSNPNTGRGLGAGFNPGLPLNVQMNIRSSIQRLNMGLSAMKDIYKTDGQDETAVDGYLLNLMTGMGFDPTQSPQTFTQQMLRSIVTARAAEAFRKAGATQQPTQKGNMQ